MNNEKIVRNIGTIKEIILTLKKRQVKFQVHIYNKQSLVDISHIRREIQGKTATNEFV